MATRVSTRVRTRSAKAVEAEATESLLAAAKVKQNTAAEANSKRQQSEEGHTGVAGNGQVDTREDGAPESEGNAAKKPTRRRGKKTYCICQKGARGEMIQCEGCKDWFHFDCMNLNAEEADKIQFYACPGCIESKGIKTTFADEPADLAAPAQDEQGKPSPTKPESKDEPSKRAPAKRTSKRKASGKQEAAPVEAPTADKTEDSAAAEPSDDVSQSDSSNGDSGSEAAHSDGEDEDEDEDYEDEHIRKKPRTHSTGSQQQRRPSLPLHERRRSSTSTAAPQSPVTPVAPGALPAARQYVADKMSAVIRTIIGDSMTEAEASDYGHAVELSLFSTLNETVKGKRTAGGRYKAQFNLLHGSLSKFQDLNPELIASIRDRTLTPAKVAALNSTELANAEQRAIIEKAEAEALRQRIRIKEEQEAVRAGRDGLEFMPDTREEEMNKIRRQEEDARERERRREAGEHEPTPESERRTSVDVSQSPVSAAPPSPMAERREHSPSVRRVSSSSLATPRPSISISSAWGDKKREEPTQSESIEMGEQEIDLSDMVPETTFSDAEEEMELDREDTSEMAKLLAQPVGWTGGIINPAVQTPPPPIELRHLSSQPLPSVHWSRLIPEPNITITGRVPTAHSLKYLSDRRSDPGKHLQPVLLSVPSSASQAERDAFAALVEFHISRDRHGIYHPFGNRPPPGTAREVYLVPLRPSDTIPPILSELGALLPEARPEPVIVAVFLAPAPPIRSPVERPPPAAAAYVPPPQVKRGPPLNAPTGPRGPPTSAPIGPKSTVAAVTAAAPVLHNAQLQALMASLDANAIAGVMKSPVAGGASPAPPVASSAPPPPTGLPPFAGSLPTAYPPPPPKSQAYGYSPYAGQSPYNVQATPNPYQAQDTPNPYNQGRSPHSASQQNQNPYDPYDQNDGGYSPSRWGQ